LRLVRYHQRHHSPYRVSKTQGRVAKKPSYCSLDTSDIYLIGEARERMSPGGLRGLQIRWGALEMSSVGSTPIRSRQRVFTAYQQASSKAAGKAYLPGLFRWQIGI